MAALPSYFKDFLTNIRLSTEQVEELKKGHTDLRTHLKEDERLSCIIVSVFLQGSYRRATIVRPEGGKNADVDVVVVTSLARNSYTPNQALDLFRPFVEKHYKRYKIQDRSIGIELEGVDLDLVVTSAPSEVDEEALRSDAVLTTDTLEAADDWLLHAEWMPKSERKKPGFFERLFAALKGDEWKTEPLWIPDRGFGEWVQTHPLEQMRRTRDKNAATGGHFVNVVKAVKWWRRGRLSLPKHPKSYPLEHILWHCCPDGIGSVAEGVTRSFEAIRDHFAGHVQTGSTPVLIDHGVDQDVLKRVSPGDFRIFHEEASVAAGQAREALDLEKVEDSARAWRELFGNEFPPPPDEENETGGGFSKRKAPSLVVGADFA